VMGVIGDLAALHDLNSLHLVRQSQYPIVLVIINNHGGGIFSHLPIAQHSAVFEPYFETPHPYDFESAAKQFGLERRLVTKLADTENLPEWLSSKSSLIIEIQTERSIQADFRRQLTARIHQLL
ncbi:MAG TPA: 2-succinyl-5-enolpyruvyl-6-hydroxy-3-cyclohexene-1-carboxylate synthase, partial [Candidatus Marinimicrobia bacterium]|nr:2-succinyl-5-enolpyruvyl-6-hydroxy-3-cyclohexene-1-carboxylate synthase [Candidatus Neomarinimicrobiota bacterium]